MHGPLRHEEGLTAQSMRSAHVPKDYSSQRSTGLFIENRA